MEKSAKPNESNSGTKVNASYAAKEQDISSPAFDNDSKYQPTGDADLNSVALDPSDGLRKLFLDSIRDIYWAENHLVMGLPKMAKAASLQPLQQAILDLLEQTKIHVQRLEQVFELLGREPQAKKCDAMEGLSKEGEGVIETTDAGTPARNLGIIMASQKVEHYEISSYTGLANLAISLGLTEAADLLNQTLAEEQDSDQKLAQIADSNYASADRTDSAQTDTGKKQ
jgi:ferritin-like metal-binding protein YciE